MHKMDLGTGLSTDNIMFAYYHYYFLCVIYSQFVFAYYSILAKEPLMYVNETFLSNYFSINDILQGSVKS